jgi:hypothetical protein
MISKIKLSAIIVALFAKAACLNAQCATITVTGDLVASTQFYSGTYSITGNFIVPSGVNVLVKPYSNGACGKLEIYAKSAKIYGTIDANGGGFLGGSGGGAGANVTSITNDQAALTGCSNKDNTGQVTIEGGKAGMAGFGPGAGAAGSSGQVGSGPKQKCGNFGDDAGIFGTGGGAGGGAGGSYGGKASNAGSGGNGVNTFTQSNVAVSNAFLPLAGNGGSGGSAGVIYGTAGGNDIDLGSGGGGAGGGALSFAFGAPGATGGSGGGQIKIVVQDTLIVSGNISANGAVGGIGGFGGNGGVAGGTSGCCGDGCDDGGERSFSCGAGAGSGGGGGSGGGIYLEAGLNANISGNLNVRGGNGGLGGLKGLGFNYSGTSGGSFCASSESFVTAFGNDGKAGGGGGGGRIKIFVPSCIGSTITPVTSLLAGTGFTTAVAGTYSLMCNNDVSVQENTVYHALLLYPNPTSETLNINFKFPQYLKDNKAEILIFDINSKLVKTVSSQLHEKDVQTINTAELSNGVYFIKLLSSDATVIEKFIKN